MPRKKGLYRKEGRKDGREESMPRKEGRHVNDVRM